MAVNDLNANATTSRPSTWCGLLRTGGVCALLYVLLALFVPFFMYINNTELSYMVSGAEILALIQEKGFYWWTVLQTLVLGASFLAIITFAALFVALKEVDKSRALIGSLLAIIMHILFVAYYPLLLALGYLSQAHQFADAPQRHSFETAAEPLIAINNAFNPLYEAVFAVSILLLSLVMLKGVFDRKVAYIGIVTSVSAFIALALHPLLGVGYLWWWLLFLIWFIAVGVRLYRIGAHVGG